MLFGLRSSRQSLQCQGGIVYARLLKLACGFFLILVVSSSTWGQGIAFDLEPVDQGASLRTQAIASLETALAANPNNLDIHMKLLGYYSRHDPTMTGPLRPKVISETEWLIEHDPASPILRRLHFVPGDFPPGDKKYPRVVALVE